MIRFLTPSMIAALVVLIAGSPSYAVQVKTVPGGQAKLGFIEVQGVGAGEFDPSIWKSGEFTLLPDDRSPLLAPRQSGVFRNIYAPSAVETPTGWRLFYGAWDGVATGNDRIYSVETRDFIDFASRETVIDHGPFIHVCNVNAIRRGENGYLLACTAYPDKDGLNKPILFSSEDGVTWNGTETPYPATFDDLITIEGYEAFAAGDMNGMNVLLQEGEAIHFYFNNFKDWGKVYRATGNIANPNSLTFEGSVLDAPRMVNDVKRFESEGKTWRLMGLHQNRDQLWYSLSEGGQNFQPEKLLLSNLGEEDRYIVALGWVTRGNRILGVLYGAGAVPGLNRNRIFARWLQKKAVFTSEKGRRYEPTSALGPDRQLIPIPEGLEGDELKGTLQLYAEDGQTPLGDPVPWDAHDGRVYRVNP